MQHGLFGGSLQHEVILFKHGPRVENLKNNQDTSTYIAFRPSKMKLVTQTHTINS